MKPRPSPLKIYPEEKLIDCYVSWIKSPSEFYIHLRDEKSSLLEPLRDRLNALYHNSRMVRNLKPEIGSYWVIQESRPSHLKYWSRVKILSAMPNGANKNVNDGHTVYKVFLVDWGNVELVYISQLRPLVKEILDIPCLAIRCRLDGISPIDAVAVC